MRAANKMNRVDYYREGCRYYLRNFTDSGRSLPGTKCNLSREDWCAKHDALARAAMKAAGIWYGPARPKVLA